MEETKPQASSKVKDANRLIRNHAIGAAAVVLVPLPLLDVAAMIGIHVNLVRTLANLYEVPFSEDIGKSAVTGLISSSLPTAAWSLAKFIPIVGAISASAASVASIYAAGKIFVQHFESGGTFLTFDPEKVREHYESELRKGASPDVAQEEGEDYGGVKP